MKNTNEAKGLILGSIAIIIFASTLPVTKIAVGGDIIPSLDPIFVTMARASGGGILALIFLLQNRFPRVPSNLWPALIISALGTVFGFPFFLAIGLRTADPTHAAVITGLLPLGTAVCAAIYFKQKPSLSFWFWAIVGAITILLFMLFNGGGVVKLGDLFLVFAVFSASIGYVTGARISAIIKPVYVISWALVISLPLSSLLSFMYWPTSNVSWESWFSVIYLAVFAMWIGFVIWYKALVLGGTMRVSQVQLVQPFIALLLCWPLLGEIPSSITYVFLVCLMLVVYMSKNAKVS